MSITANEQTVSLQWVDAMEWLYPDVAPGVDPESGRLQALRGGCVAVQVAVRDGPDAAGNVRLRWGGYEQDCTWPAPQIFVLKAVSVLHNTIDPCKQVEWRPEAAANVTRRAPFRVCDHYGCSGYLHWGGNQWGKDKDMYADTDQLPLRLHDRASSPACALPGTGSGGREAHTKGNLT